MREPSRQTKVGLGYLERGEYNPSLELAFRLAELFRVPIEAIYARRPFRPLSEALYPDARPVGEQGNESIG